MVTDVNGYSSASVLKPHTELTKTKLRGLSPQANYTDRATTAVGEVVPTFAGRGVLRGKRNGSPRPLISVFYTRAGTSSFK
jgi:hypothetical protein